MLKKICLITVLLGVFTMFSSCNKDNDIISNNENSNSSEIILKAGNKNIPAMVISSDANDSDTQFFQSIMSENDITIPYVKLGETIQIEFNNTVTNTYQLKDYILKEDGTPKYEEKTIKTTNIKFDKGIGSFVLNENIWVNFSSNSKDYEPGKTIRGFRLICEDIDKEYVFIIKTDDKVKK